MFHPALFRGANVVVTGAGRGIGLEIARQFLDCGAHVLLHGGRAAADPLPDFLDSAIAEARAHIVYSDFLVEGGIGAILQRVDSLFPHVDALINNAGTMVGRFPAADLTDEQYDTVVRLNQTSVVEVTRALLPSLRRAPHAAIVNTVSISALTGGSPGSAIYSATKAFVSTLFEGPRPRTGAGWHPRKLRLARHHHHRFPLALFIRGQAGGDAQDDPVAAPRHGGRLRARLSLPRLPRRCPATSPARCWR
jgi:NAD(P)-dependent dehydrogenase (short-subunit alcohol dehydrogenase family)